MKKFKVFFELYGEKMQCTIECESKTDIFNCIANKINIHKVDVIDNNECFNDPVNSLKDIFGFK